ncbi:uncharacterized protein LOC121201714 [Betta splendens]|uniref:Uncharacterized protein LOC121201714 n=1 Tax=Betta splendens TaxID=158456 RepID=A0A9W2XC52_BETSP|nr:uncharacterized protein LOC121201714 [Betta splendens]
MDDVGKEREQEKQKVWKSQRRFLYNAKVSKPESKEASNTCPLTSLLLLKVSIYDHFGATASKMSSLEQLCSLLPINPWHWLNLCLQQLENNKITGGLEFLLHFSDHFISYFHKRQHRLAESLHMFHQDEVQCVTVIRRSAGSSPSADLIVSCSFHLSQTPLSSSFVLQRSENALHSTDEALQRLSPKEATLQALTEVMSEDLIPEKMREDYQDGESLTSVCVQSFRERWWNKVLMIGVLHTDGYQRNEELKS